MLVPGRKIKRVVGLVHVGRRCLRRGAILPVVTGAWPRRDGRLCVPVVLVGLAGLVRPLARGAALVLGCVVVRPGLVVVGRGADLVGRRLVGRGTDLVGRRLVGWWLVGRARVMVIGGSNWAGLARTG